MAPSDAGPQREAYAPPVSDDRNPVSVADGETLGQALQNARNASLRSIDQLADITRVRGEYLRALEENAWDRLPSRPFTLGYVRAYARALGLEEHAAADRFKAEYPDETTRLHAPVGSELADVKRRSPYLLIGVGVIITGIVAWNVSQRVISAKAVAPSEIESAPSTWRQGQPLSVIQVSAPLPAPPDQSVPAPYITPGLDPEAQTGATDAAPLPPGPSIPVGAAFNPKGATYGAAPNASAVILQAREATNIVVRSADGKVIYFARQLAAGEAWRAPLTGNMVIDVSDPPAFAVYLNGEYHGSLDAPLTQLSRLNGQAAQSAAAAQRAAAAAQAQAARDAAARDAVASSAAERASAAAAEVHAAGPVAAGE